MAITHVTGPVHIYVGTDHYTPTSGYGSAFSTLRTTPVASGYISYLGTCETPPRILINPRWKPLMADIAGDELPFDFAFNGEDAQIQGVLNRWNEYVYYHLAARPRTTGTRGTYTASDLGTLMLHEGRAIPLWLHFPYSAAKAYGATYSMPAGYRFLATFPVTPEEIQGGARASKRLITWQAMPVYSATDGTWCLYDHDMTNIPSIPPTGTTGALS